ncbi:hypothetical protein GCM10011365_25900 [Marinicella pacifica]|uniref:Sulfatase N-terminal domain-containing protein n=1 Tax=Marinicella pacifica TaxID=1171543 RepID=A0A917D136_9GAMM|nr:sulfatase-like hydrolase/transferase [Marinicella pacifica]GGG03586.1 hypothetical protein GCM10011365_25900 [Marinicella pacifica]
MIYFFISKLKFTKQIALSKIVKFKALIYISVFIAIFIFSIFVSYERTNPKKWINEPFLSALAENNSEFIKVKNRREILLDKKERQYYFSSLENKIKTNKPQRNIILIIVDGLRADRMSLYGYEKYTTPNLNELISNNFFQYIKIFTSTCSDSVCGIYSILSSRRYDEFGFGLLDLTEVLKTIGYEVFFILSSNHSYMSLKQLYGESIDVFHDGISFKDSVSINDDYGVIQKLETIDSYTEQPRFFYLHFMSAHLLGKIKEEFAIYKPYSKQTPALLSSLNNVDYNHYLEKISNGYNNGVLQADYYIKKSLDILKDKGYLANSLVVITGDHGEGLGERGNFSHTFNLYQEDINVPFLWHSEGCNLKTLDYGTHIDIAPTILDCLNLPIPMTWKGNSLISKPQNKRLTYHQTVRIDKVVMVIEESKNHLYKLMANYSGSDFSKFRLFDIYNDPKEQINLINKIDPKHLEYLKYKLVSYFSEE